MPLTPGELVLDRYVVEEMVGLGGMGEVYRATHQKLGMSVAVKTITDHSNADLVQRFEREAMLLARVHHPNIVGILDVGNCQDGSPCMVMEFLEGEALDARLARRKALTWPEVQAIGVALAAGLDAIHGAGIVHRDLKPANVLATRGNPEVIKLVDFGIAYPTSAQAAKFTQAGLMVGTPAYMAPEQLVAADVDARTDIYCAALLLYELATGRLPFGEDPQAALKRLNSVIPPPVAPRGLPPIPPGAVSCLMACLSIDQNARPASARDMGVLLMDPGTGAGVPVPPPPPHPQAGAPHPPAAQPPPPPPAAAVGHPPAAQPQYPGYAQQHAAPPGTVAGAAPPPPVPHTPQTYEASRAATMTQPAGPSRALVAARMPQSRLSSRTEQQALAQLAAPGRAYHMGGGMWFAVLTGNTEDAAKTAANTLGMALQERFGSTCKVVWAPATEAFSLTPASLSGAAPLPREVSRLLEALL